MVVDIEGVPLHLAHPDELSITWVGQDEVMRQLLPEHQEKQGPERGSWDPNGDRWGGQAGRLYVTCLSLYTLEVYYRHLPIYEHGAMTNHSSK